MKEYTFFAQGEPKAQPRPRAFSRGGHARVFDPGTAEGWKSQIAIAAKPWIEYAGTLHGPISVGLMFYMPRPQSHYAMNKREGVRKLRPSAPRRPTKKPDCDNLAKAVLDALTTLGAWEDDKNVIELKIKKHYAFNRRDAGCEVTIKEVVE